MARQMPRFDQDLAHKAQSAIDIARAGEIVRAIGDHAVRREWSLHRLEALYELAFIRIFSEWEVLLESVFYRSLCGYVSNAGQETLIAGTYYRSIAAAQTAVHAGQQYLLWHNPYKVIHRCQSHIRSRNPLHPAHIGQQEFVLSSNVARLQWFGSIRHRIAHAQQDARVKFDTACLGLAARTYSGSRPGKFLRDFDTGSLPSRRWLDSISDELVSLAGQIV
jgi:hypothetical protein